MPSLSHALLVAGLFSLSAGSFAQKPGPSPTGGPGAQAPGTSPTRNQIKDRLETRFDRIDANHDGTIDRQDAEARRAARTAQQFARIDADRNGSISRDEFAAAQGRKPMAGRALSPGRRMLFRRGGGRLRGPLPFAPLAGGADGKPAEPLTKSSFVDRGLARFDRVDIDHDGAISQAERDAARSAVRNWRSRPKSPLFRPTPSRSEQ